MERDHKLQLLRSLRLGDRIAENEVEQLQQYFVHTEDWRKVLNDEVDIVYGQKGTGKSAIYLLIHAHEDELFDRNIILLSAENARNTPAFSNLSHDPPTTEREFVYLWKLYLATLLCHKLDEFDFKHSSIDEVRSKLADLGLLDRRLSLTNILKICLDYVRNRTQLESVQTSVTVDPNTGMPIATGKVTLNEPGVEEIQRGYRSIDDLISRLDDTVASHDFNAWLLLDRLDVAFNDNPELEANALRALFRAYSGFGARSAIQLKIFLRKDIWDRITETGFREASHITRYVNLEWNEQGLLNLVVQRFLNSSDLETRYGVAKNHVMSSSDRQTELFYRIFPRQVDSGPNKPSTFNWMLARTADSTRQTAPRELIHLLTAARDVQIARYERGEIGQAGEQLFEPISLKEALPEVSTVRLNQTLYAETPELKRFVQALHGRKTQQSIESLKTLWDRPADQAQRIADQLADVGFFVRKVENGSVQYWVPFLYRDALEMSQGSE